MQITQDKVDYAKLTQADADANDSAAISRKISVRLSPAARMKLSALIDAAEQAEADLEARFAEGNPPAALAKRVVMDDLILRVASAPVPDVELAERRVRCLARHWKAYRDSSRRSVVQAIIGAALLADCDAHNFSVSWVDTPPSTLH